MSFFFHRSVDRLVLHSFPTRRSSDLVSESGERKTLPRNSHTAGSWSSCVGDTVVDLDLLLHRPTGLPKGSTDRKSTRLNSSHLGISYAVFCLKKKKTYGNHMKIKYHV